MSLVFLILENQHLLPEFPVFFLPKMYTFTNPFLYTDGWEYVVYHMCCMLQLSCVCVAGGVEYLL